MKDRGPPSAARPGALPITLPVTLLVQAASSAATIAPTVAAPRLLAQLDVGPVAVGAYIALVYVLAMLSSQWGATLVRRWGPIRTSQAALACSLLGLAAMTVPDLRACALGALLIGLGYGPITPASSEMLARTTDPARLGLVFSIKQTGVPLGGAFAGVVVPAVLLGWGTTWALAAMAFACFAALLLAQPLRRGLDDQRQPSSPLPAPRDIVNAVRSVLGRAALRRLALATLVLSAVQVSLTSYLVSYLHSELGWDLVAAGAALSVAQGSAIVGRIAWGALADRLQDGSRRMLAALTLAMTAGTLAMAGIGADTPAPLVLALLVVHGATAIGWNGVFLGAVARAVPRTEAAAATAGCLFFTFAGVVVGPFLFGLAGSAFGSLGPAFALLAVPLAVAIRLLMLRGEASTVD